MLRNLLITAWSIAVIFWTIYVLKRHKSYSFAQKNFALCLFILWFFSTFIFNIPVIMSPLTPAITGKVIDSEKNLPIASCNIKAYWLTVIGVPGGEGHWDTYHQVITKTDEKGDFRIPRYVKALGLYGLFPILLWHYEGIELVAYTHGFRYSIDKVRRVYTEPEIIVPNQPVMVEKIIKMSKSRPSDITNDIFRLDHLFEMQNLPRGKTLYDNIYLLNDYIYYYDRFEEFYGCENREYRRSAYIYFASAFKHFGQKRRAIDVYRKLITEYPDSAKFAEQEIESIKVSLKSSSGGVK